MLMIKSGYPLLSAEEEIELAERIQNGDEEARERFILSNIGIVYKYAKVYSRYYHNSLLYSSLSLEDIAGFGFIGLIKAVDRYNPAYGTRFSSYAIYYIKGYISRNLFEDCLIKIPEYQKPRFWVLWCIKDEYFAEHGEYPSISEICRMTGWKRKSAKITIEAESDFQSYCRGYDDCSDLESKLQGPYDLAFGREIGRTLLEFYKTLNKKERAIVRHLFVREKAMYNGSTLAGKLGVTRQRVDQIRGKVVEKAKFFFGRFLDGRVEYEKKVEKLGVYAEERLRQLFSEINKRFERICWRGLYYHRWVISEEAESRMIGIMRQEIKDKEGMIP